MNFASYEFWKLLILCFIGSRLVIAVVRLFFPSAEQSTAKLCLLATALFLLYAENPITLAAFLWVILLGWCCLLLPTVRCGKFLKNFIFVLLLVGQLAPLFYYKYWNFILNETFGLHFQSPSALIPMGLSFYTFQTIGFWVDHLRTGEPRPTFIDYLNFSSFFPQIVAGPIEKSEDLLPQIQTNRFRIHYSNLNTALQWIILGLGYKLIVADNLGNLSQKFLFDPLNAWHVWLECLVFSIRIYFDFAGYSFIAVGLGLLFGAHLTLNFRCPYWSKNLREFWRNWHVTLGAWLRDYIYFPLGGKRVKWWAVNTLIVFLISGIWHGAGWGFIIWGLLHGAGIIMCSHNISLLKLDFLKKIPLLQTAITFIYITGAWLFFFETDPEVMWQKALTAVQPTAYNLSYLFQLPKTTEGPSDLLSMATIIIIAFAALLLEGIDVKKQQEPYRLARSPIFSLLIVFLIIMLAPMEESSFIYFNF